MLVFLSNVFSYVGKYWKYWLPVLGIVVILLVVYYKGGSNIRNKIGKVTAEDTLKRTEEAHKVETRDRKTKTRIDTELKKTQDGKDYADKVSDLLSKDPTK